MSYQFAYLTGNAILFLIWLGLFVFRKDLRHKILLMSFIVGFFGPLSELFYLRDYWNPQLFNGWIIGLEDYLFGFFIGGIASVLYEEVFGLRFAKRHYERHYLWMFGFFVLSLSVLILGNLILGINSIYVSMAIFMIVGLIIIATRHDLLKAAIFSGLLLSTLMLFFYLVFLSIFPGLIQDWWKLSNISGILLLGIPLEELLWGFGWGFVAGPFYEFTTGLRFKKI